MSGNPNHDEAGRFSSSPGGVAEKARTAIDWVKSPEARARLKGLAHPDNVKAVATFAVQSALFKIAGVNDPGIDAAVKYTVHNLANDLKTTNAHARQVMLSVVRSMLSRNKTEE